jgi:hypothetical protein
MCVCPDMLGTLLLIYIMYAWTCYAWLLEHVMYGCHGCMICMSIVPFFLFEACISFLVMNLTKPPSLQNASRNARPSWRQSATTPRAKHGVAAVAHA